MEPPVSVDKTDYTWVTWVTNAEPSSCVYLFNPCWVTRVTTDPSDPSVTYLLFKGQQPRYGAILRPPTMAGISLPTQDSDSNAGSPVEDTKNRIASTPSAMVFRYWTY